METNIVRTESAMSFKVKIFPYSYVLNSNLPSMLMPQGYHLFSKPLISHPHLTFLCLFFVYSLSIVNIVEGVFVHRFSCSGFPFTSFSSGSV